MMTCYREGLAARRYNRRVLISMAIYGVLLVGAMELTLHGGLGGTARYAVALLPALPIIAMFGVMGRYVMEETDEYLRNRMVRQSLYAAGFALSVATVWGFLEALADAPHIPAYYVAVTWFVGNGVGGLIVWAQDR